MPSICQVCSVSTPNPKFCSKSCAAKFNNKIKPKRKKIFGVCKKCKCQIEKTRSYCKPCRLPEDMTLKEAIYDKHHKSSAYALVRSRARATEKIKNSKSCLICGYDKHIEACHIKPIHSFDESTLISIINSDKNLIPMCRNCHWEFDNGLLDNKLFELQLLGLDSNQQPSG